MNGAQDPRCEYTNLANRNCVAFPLWRPRLSSSSMVASQPLALMTRPRNSRRFGIVADQQDGILARVFRQHFLKVGEGRLRTQAHFPARVCLRAPSHCPPGTRSGWSAFSGLEMITSHVNSQSGQRAANVAALLDAVLVQPALFVLLGIGETLSGAGVTQESK